MDHWLSLGHGGWRWRRLWLAVAGGVPKWGFGLNGHDHLVVAQCGAGLERVRGSSGEVFGGNLGNRFGQNTI